MRNEWFDEDATVCPHPITERGLVVIPAFGDPPYEVCILCGTHVVVTPAREEELARAA